MAWQDYYEDDELVGSVVYYGQIYLKVRKFKDNEKWQLSSPGFDKELNSGTIEEAKLEARLVLKEIFYEAYKAMDADK